MVPRISYAAMAFFLLLASCAGAPPQPAPRHLTGGAEQVTRGSAAYAKGCYSTALDHFYRAYELFSASDQPLGVAMSLNNLGNIYRAVGRPEDALGLFEEAEDLYAASGEQAGLRQVLSNRAAALIDLGRLDEAEQALSRAGRINPPDSSVFVPLMVNRGILLTRRGDYTTARQVLGTAVQAVGAVEAKPGPSAPEAAAAHFAMGKLLMETGDFRGAAGNFQAALKADQAAGFYAGLADDLQKLGDAYQKLGDGALALNYWKRSVRIYALLGMHDDTDAVMGKLKAQAARSGAKLDVIEAFVQRCRDTRNRGERLCD